jgi:type IX secretion system PorP/SprF family membrane protein
MSKRFNMKKVFIAVVAVLFISSNLYAQQVPFYSQYYFNPFIYNPAFTGTSGEVNGFLTHHNQWTDIPGAPITSSLTIDGPLKREKAGLGVSIFNDATDITHRIGVGMAYSYAVDINDDHHLRFGISAGILNNQIDFSKARVGDVSDPNLFNQSQQKSTYDATFGVAYNFDELTVGVALPQLFDNNVNYSQLDDDFNTAYSLKRHYLVTAGYHYQINDDFAVTPMVLTRITPGAPFQFDFNAIGSYQDFANLAISYKHQYALGVNPMFKINEKLMVGLSYDIFIGDIGDFAGTSTELMVGYTFGVSKEEKEAREKMEEEQRAELDSLKNQLEETSKLAKTNREDIDNLSDELNKVKVEVDEAIEELKKNPPVASGGTSSGEPKVFTSEEDESLSNEYLDNNGNKLPKGFYIVVGSYSEQKWAEKAKERFTGAGWPDTDILYNITNKFYNVYLSGTTNEQEARDALKRARADYPDAWLRKIQ